jgi:hypothetical protein
MGVRLVTQRKRGTPHTNGRYEKKQGKVKVAVWFSRLLNDDKPDAEGIFHIVERALEAQTGCVRSILSEPLGAAR